MTAVRTRGSPGLLAAAAAPAVGILGWMVPIGFFERLQSDMHALAPWELWPLYGTLVLLVLPLAIAASLLCAALRKLQVAAARRWSFAASVEMPNLVFAVTVAIGLSFGLQIWLRGLRVEVGWWPAMRWVVLAAIGVTLASRGVRRAVDALMAPARAVTFAGVAALVTLPLFGWHESPVARGTPQADSPNIVLLTFDAMTASHLSAYGYPRQTSPELERFTAQGAQVDRFYAASNFTTSGINSIISGALPSRHGAMQLSSWPRPRYREHSLPAVLQSAGYHTYAVSTNPLAGPYKNGYGAYFDEVASDRINDYFSGRDGPSRWLKYLGPCLENELVNVLWRPIGFAHWFWRDEQAANLHYDPRKAFDAARALLAHRAAGPVFLWVHVLPPHSPYAAPRPFLQSFDATPRFLSAADSSPPFGFAYGAVDAEQRKVYEARYDETIRFLDAQAGAFLRDIDSMLGTNTYVLISADHGESFSHGYGGHAGRLLSEDLLRIPLLAKGPGIAPGSRIEGPASQVDIAPTIASWGHAAPPTLWQGRSLAGALRGEPLTPAPVYAMNLERARRSQPFDQGSISVVSGDWKRIRHFGLPRSPEASPLGDGLFELRTDAAEAHDLAGARPDEAARLDALLSQVMSREAGE